MSLRIPSRYVAWTFLGAAILLEVAGTITMKIATRPDSFISPEWAMGLMYVLIAVSYSFLALAVTKMPVGVAYAFWEGLGLTIITLVSVVALGESLTWTRFAALAAVVAGAALIHHGTSMTRSKALIAPARDAEANDAEARDAAYGRAM